MTRRNARCGISSGLADDQRGCRVNRPPIELAEVVRRFGPAYKAAYGATLTPAQQQAYGPSSGAPQPFSADMSKPVTVAATGESPTIRSAISIVRSARRRPGPSGSKRNLIRYLSPRISSQGMGHLRTIFGGGSSDATPTPGQRLHPKCDPTRWGNALGTSGKFPKCLV